MQVASKKFYWKNNRVFQKLAPYWHWKRYFIRTYRCIFQIFLKYIKFVIPKILFILVLCSFNFYFKITWPRPTIYPPPPKEKFLPPPPPSKDFSETFNFAPPHPPPPHPQAGGGGCMPWLCWNSIVILNLNYLPPICIKKSNSLTELFFAYDGHNFQ